MKRSICLSVFLAVPLSACGNNAEPAAPPSTAPSVVEVRSGAAQAKVQAAIAQIRAEPKVKDVIYDAQAAVNWQAGVVGDGTPQFGYAEYLCQVIKSAGATDERTIVRVVDLAQVSEGRDFHDASLGAVDCADGSHFDDAPGAKA